MEPRSRDKILVDALTAERARLSKRLAKLKGIRASDPIKKILELHKEAEGLDFKTKEGMAKLGELADRETAARAELAKIQKRDYLKDIEEETTIEFEIGQIDSELSMKKFFGRGC
ncbi:hypothetical protein [Aeromonas hydrophila]|uniref:hypothetical protein n=1 Tax=Aeromonas hydrophila TaxID=644 RepID=UPI003D1D4D52